MLNRNVRKLMPTVKKAAEIESRYSQLSAIELKNMTAEFKHRLDCGESLDAILPEAFAVVSEAAWRVLGMRPYPVQIIGGIVLHQGRIAEMKTGEGKTLVAILPAYLNALTGDGVHIVTVNDYLAKRDSEQMGKVFEFLGLTVGLIVHDKTTLERKAAYACDITYGTNTELGFDYLRDNMALEAEDRVQRGHNYAVVDEVDSILIDEARTPLIISGQGNKGPEIYEKADSFVKGLKKKIILHADNEDDSLDVESDADYIVEEKAKTVYLTQRGIAAAENYFNIANYADTENLVIVHHVNQALKAYGIMSRDTDYIVNAAGEVLIVDEYTGRTMEGRRFSDGLHQALEAKEGVKINVENQTLASVTYQNYFRLYKKLSGMTGTALTEKDEFEKTYSLNIVEIPTNKPVLRVDHEDEIYLNEKAKLNAVVEQVKLCHNKGQPVLIGTASVEKSECLSWLLDRNGIEHSVLNAKNHEKEAYIIAQAGKYGAVTIATNMAGRGTDIILGGNAEYMAIEDMQAAGYSNDMILEATGYGDTEDPAMLDAREKYAEYKQLHKEEIAKLAEKVKKAGGLYVIGTEHHDSRRVDNQLRGRSGRQGDVGESKFFIAIDDKLMRLFASQSALAKYRKIFNASGDAAKPLNSKPLRKAVAYAQEIVESRHFQMRSNVLEYDDVMNTQRKLVYAERSRVLDGEDLYGSIENMIYDVIEKDIQSAIGNKPVISSQTELNMALEPFTDMFVPRGHFRLEQLCDGELTVRLLVGYIYNFAVKIYIARNRYLGYYGKTNKPVIQTTVVEKRVLLHAVDKYWMENLEALELLKHSIGLEGYAQRNPIDVFKEEAFRMYDSMIDDIKHETVARLFEIQNYQMALASEM